MAQPPTRHPVLRPQIREPRRSWSTIALLSIAGGVFASAITTVVVLLNIASPPSPENVVTNQGPPCPPAVIDSTLSAAALEASEAIVSECRFVPSIVDGQFRGYKVFAISEASWWAAAGLKPGDTLVGVEDQPFSDPIDIATAFNTIGEKPTTISVIRRGCPLSINLSIAK